MSNPKQVILIVGASFYSDIASALLKGAISKLDAIEGTKYEHVNVPGVFEVPSAVNAGWESGEFDGCITLGCVIRGETDHYEHICREVTRKLMDISIDKRMPHGFGILTCENMEQAITRSDVNGTNQGARAADACLHMVGLLNRFQNP
ncbi:MAG: 6,7-dimethyl-8-ribityllumazine synthase [Pseudomonadota bacterium]|nr:6,7-dimethyl-8-ribityllumazine synthase [Pseudomonadota bacterium]